MEQRFVKVIVKMMLKKIARSVAKETHLLADEYSVGASTKFVFVCINISQCHRFVAFAASV